MGLKKNKLYSFLNSITIFKTFILLLLSPRKKCPYSEFFCSVSLGLNANIYSVKRCIQSECWKIWIWKSPDTDKCYVIGNLELQEIILSNLGRTHDWIAEIWKISGQLLHMHSTTLIRLWSDFDVIKKHSVGVMWIHNDDNYSFLRLL